MAFKFRIPVLDRKQEARSAFEGWQLAAADAVTGAALQAALEGIVLGVPQAVTQIEETELVAPIAGPAPNTAQRGAKLLARYLDGDGSRHTAEIPCADSSVLAAGSDFVDLAAGAGLTFKQAFEAHVASPPEASGAGGGTAVTLISLEWVNRPIK